MSYKAENKDTKNTKDNNDMKTKENIRKVIKFDPKKIEAPHSNFLSHKQVILQRPVTPSGNLSIDSNNFSQHIKPEKVMDKSYINKSQHQNTTQNINNDQTTSNTQKMLFKGTPKKKSSHEYFTSSGYLATEVPGKHEKLENHESKLIKAKKLSNTNINSKNNSNVPSRETSVKSKNQVSKTPHHNKNLSMNTSVNNVNEAIFKKDAIINRLNILTKKKVFSKQQSPNNSISEKLETSFHNQKQKHPIINNNILSMKNLNKNNKDLNNPHCLDKNIDLNIINLSNIQIINDNREDEVYYDTPKKQINVNITFNINIENQTKLNRPYKEPS